MKILIISGFLGAGKTTFIKEMVKATKREYIILENEFADINIDGEILKKDENLAPKELDVYELTNGCICCNMKGDFTASLLVIDNSLNPDFLIIEPSGVGVLSSIIDAIKKVEYERIQLLKPIAIVDAMTYFKYKEKYNNVFIDQIKNATYVQLSKTEQMAPGDIDGIRRDILTINPDCIVYGEHYKQATMDYWDNLFEGELNATITPLDDPDSGLQNMSYRNACCKNLGAFMCFLNQIVLGFYGDICRAKGVIKTDEGNLRFDLVDGIYAVTGAGDDETNHVIFIGNDLNTLQLKTKLVDMSGNVKVRVGQKGLVKGLAAKGVTRVKKSRG